MDIGSHEITEGLVNQSVSRYRAKSFESLRHDSDVEVPLAFLCSGVSGVQMTLVLDQQLGGIERGLQAPLDLRGSGRLHGNTRLKGLTVTRA